MYNTRYLRVNPEKPDPLIIAEAAQYIKNGELLAFPTETVYGLGADAMQANAAAKIFIAKGRPADHPLLVHVSRIEQAEKLASEIPAAAYKLMEEFWPGPLSIILPAQPQVPEIVRGNKSSVGFRMPSHPVSIALIDAAGPLAAPSANLYGRPSPTSADHVRQDLDGKIAAVLDAGETGTGLESTIIDFSCGVKILRRGSIAVEDIEEFLGRRLDVTAPAGDSSPAYDIKVRVLLSRNNEDFNQLLQQCTETAQAIGLVRLKGSERIIAGDFAQEYILDLSGQGTSWFSILRNAESKKLDSLLIEPIDRQASGIAASILERIQRAANPLSGKGK